MTIILKLMLQANNKRKHENVDLLFKFLLLVLILNNTNKCLNKDT